MKSNSKMMSLFLFFSCMMTFLLFIKFISLKTIYFVQINLLQLNLIKLEVCFLLDSMSLSFLWVVMSISMSVYFFSYSYMSQEMFNLRFHLLVFLFIFSMFILIISPNFMSLLLGWDGLGVSSYLLVVYYQSKKSLNAGLLTAISNRVGDVFILLTLGLMMNMSSWNFYFFSNELQIKTTYMVTLLIIMASFTKSAQIPFSAWLPAAMAAPTPVSALVHSSTLVTAGVYLLVRFNKMITMSNLMMMILIIGLLTTIMAGLVAMVESDMKKMIALSTLSQLGLMMSSLGLGFIKMTFFHILSHAFFKAMLFICVGEMIHNSMDYQDLRVISSNYKNLPFNTMILLTANLSLSGFPFLSGFYSKDMILESMLMMNMNMGWKLLFFLSTMLTVMYSLRFMFLVLWNEKENILFMNSQNLDSISSKSVFILLNLSIWGGNFLSMSLFNQPNLIYLPLELKLFGLIAINMGILLLIFIFLNLKKNFTSLKFWCLNYMWNLMYLCSKLFIYNIQKMSKYINFYQDKIWNIYLVNLNFNKNFYLNSASKLKLLAKNFLKIYFMIFIIISLFYFMY